MPLYFFWAIYWSKNIEEKFIGPYEEMGIEYNIEKLVFAHKDIIDHIFDHVIDRQILRWVQLRYDFVTVVFDKKLREKVELLCIEDDQDRMIREEELRRRDKRRKSWRTQVENLMARDADEIDKENMLEAKKVDHHR